MRRRDLLTGIGLGSFSIAALARASAGQAEMPITGESGAGLEAIDQGVAQVMRRHRIPGVSLAVAKDGKLVLARGYGFAVVENRVPVKPESLFGLASVSKALTAATILSLVQHERIGLDTPVLQILDHLAPPRGERFDSRLRAVTVRMCLNHSGGWDRKRSGDPNSFEPRVERELHVRAPVTPHQLARYMMGRPLDFDPGTEAHYSNFGFVLLGLIVERVVGIPYVEAVEKITLRPMGLNRIRMTPAPPKYLASEVHRYGLEPFKRLTGGRPPMMQAAGGWAAPTVEMVRFLVELTGRRGPGFLSPPTIAQMVAPPPPPLVKNPKGGDFGLGWDAVFTTPKGPVFRKGGALNGIRTVIEHRVNGVDWALFINATTEGAEPVHPADAPPMWGDLQQQVRSGIMAVKAWPDVDLFPKFP